MYERVNMQPKMIKAKASTDNTSRSILEISKNVRNVWEKLQQLKT